MTPDITNLLNIMVVGVGLSLVVEWIKAKYATRPNVTKFLTLLLAIGVAGLYVAIRETSFFPTIMTVLGTASIVWGFFLKK